MTPSRGSAWSTRKNRTFATVWVCEKELVLARPSAGMGVVNLAQGNLHTATCAEYLREATCTAAHAHLSEQTRTSALATC